MGCNKQQEVGGERKCPVKERGACLSNGEDRDGTTRVIVVCLVE